MYTKKYCNFKLAQRLTNIENLSNKLNEELKKINKDIANINSELRYQNNKMTNGFIYMQEEINKSVKYLKDEIENLENK